jgi:hypothetical protein
MARALGGPRLILANHSIGTPHQNTFIGLVFLRKKTYSERTGHAKLVAAEQISEQEIHCASLF